MTEVKPDSDDDSLEVGKPIDLGAVAPPPLSVLETLGAEASRILLRDTPSDSPPPVVTSRTPASMEGRYHVLGEIARGGIGVVLKGRDVDLGRDVAMKVLRDEHANDPRIVQRFVEEAQISGQLQHPGIVPVYELGARADKRPFFTMKLIKGRTLAALLLDRADLAQDRRRFLAMFEQVCQTVAYAHARGVIHRDIKPSNVMVGAFGEVQVVDWGLAKVLGQGGVVDERRAKRATESSSSVIATVRTGSDGSESVAGSVMGTPAYMPPEQAVGDIESLDERSDVFSLGALLCEILTGKPPYLGEGFEVVKKSARGDVSDAKSRLASCGADAEIVALAERCLAPDADGRPRDAGVVATAVAAYLASLEDRARRAELAVVEARAGAAEQRAVAEGARAEAERQRERAEQERRTRRLTAALAATVLVGAAVGGASWLYIQRNRATRSAETSVDIDAALAQAAFLRHRATERVDVDAGRQAVEAAQHADELATSRNADEATRAKTARELLESRLDDASARNAAAKMRLAKTSLENGDFRAAATTLREVTAVSPASAEAHAALAAALASSFDIAGAVEEHRESIRLQPEDVDFRMNLWRLVFRWSWDPAEALAQAREIVRLDPESAAARSRVASALLDAGDIEGATAEAAAATRLSPEIGRRLTSRIEKRTKAVALIPEFLSGGALPEEELADALHSKRMFTAEARCRDRMVLAKPTEPKGSGPGYAAALNRYAQSLFDAAVCDALAGVGEGVDAETVDDAERRRLRGAALDKIQEMLALEGPRTAETAATPFRISVLKTTWALRGVREPARIARLPTAEQDSWRRLWADVDALIAKYGPAREWGALREWRGR